MSTCPNCGKMAGVYGSILQGCTCQWPMHAAPQQRVGLGASDERIKAIFEQYGQFITGRDYAMIRAFEAILRDQL